MTSQTSTPQHSKPAGPVSVIGLGPMGLALAETLLDRGHSLTVWNRTPGRADDLVTRGARRAPTAADAVAASPVTVVCLKDYATLYDVLDPAAAVLADSFLVNLNSGTPDEARTAADWAAGHGAGYLDGAIMVPPPLVGEPGAVFLYSGARDAFDRHHDALATLGDPRYLGTDPGLAVLHNAALLTMMYATMNGWLHATALVGSAGVTATGFAELALGWFMPAVVDPASMIAQAPDLDRSHYPGDLGTLEMNLNALEHIAHTSAEQGVHTEQPLLMRDIARRAVAEGHGEKNYLALFEVFKKALPAV
ncbi:NAD(P)-dependent oxidoreductase [Streptomyces uncialis]|uniref:NAD(P)-dependent oxidoreductase n=1 Tax=Streptomyces uncialis TaxID=1048205 RepID=UPI0037F9780D